MGLEPDTPERRERQHRTLIAYKLGLDDLLSGNATLGGGDKGAFFMLPWLEAVARFDAIAGSRDTPVTRVALNYRPYADIGQRAQFAFRQLVHDLEQGLPTMQDICTEIASLSKTDPEFLALKFDTEARSLRTIVRDGIARSEFESSGLKSLWTVESLESAMRRRSTNELGRLALSELTRDWPIFMWANARLPYLKKAIYGVRTDD